MSDKHETRTDQSPLRSFLGGADNTVMATTFLALGLFGGTIAFGASRVTGLNPFLLLVPYAVVTGTAWHFLIRKPYERAKEKQAGLEQP